MAQANIIDILWLIFSGVLVLLMQVGFLCLESGLTRAKNAINVAMKNSADFALTLVVYWMFGFGLMFGGSSEGFIGTGYFFFDLGLSEPWIAAVFIFQSMFCATAATIVSGVIAERVRFNSYLILTLVVVALIYPVSGHWVWAGIIGEGRGWLEQLGFVDFAGSTVVHSVGGWVGLAALLVIGPRVGRFVDGKVNPIPASNVTLALIGVMFFAIGWIGFNGGSTLALNEQVPGIIANTLMSGAVGAIVAYLANPYFNDQTTDDFFAPFNGCLAGLVAITAGCQAVTTLESITIGAVAAVLMLAAGRWMLQMRLDDAIGAVPVHLVAGIWGTLAVALFGDSEILGTGLDFWEQLKVQVLGIVAVGAWAFTVSYIVIRIINRFRPLRVPVEDEQQGLNVSEHGARTDLIDLLTSLTLQEKELDLSSRLHVEPFTEVGQIALGYNRVMEALNRAVAETRAIVRDIRDAIITFGEDGVLVSFNPAAEQMFGYQSDHVIGRPIRILFNQDMPKLKHPSSMILGNMSLNETTEAIGQRRNNDKFYMEVTLSQGEVEAEKRFTAVIRDIDDKRRIEEQLFKEKERALVTLGSIADGVITTDANGRVNYLNDAAQLITGWQLKEAFGLPLGDIYETSDPASAPATELIRRALDGHTVVIETQNTVLVDRQGTEHAITHSISPIRDATSTVFGAVVVFHDVTSSRALERRLSHQANHDALTGTLNRIGFESLATRVINQAAFSDAQHILAFLDLDQFKIVNDTCGHFAGDELLRQICYLIKDQLREDDVVARLGGDEFALLLRDCDRINGERVANAIRQKIQDFRFPWDAKQFAIGVSIGLVSITRQTPSLAKLMSAADSACYVAKDKGRNRIQFHEPGDIELAERRDQIEWVSKIRDAIDHQRLRLYFQPIIPVSPDQGLLPHLEIFIRMLGEEGEIYPPGSFIPVAERYNLIQEIDLWVVRHTCEWLASIVASGSDAPLVAINLSGPTVGDPNSLEKIIALFVELGVDFHQVSFEITETAAISNLGAATKFMTALNEKGCKFSLDDFGSGLSSFGYLRDLPVDYLKIDGVFIRDIDTNRIDRVMVQSINTIGQEMGLKTIAEFVENESILNELIEIGVDFAQGYHIARPAPIEDWQKGLAAFNF